MSRIKKRKINPQILMKRRPKSGYFLFNGRGNGNFDEFNKIKKKN